MYRVTVQGYYGRVGKPSRLYSTALPSPVTPKRIGDVLLTRNRLVPSRVPASATNRHSIPASRPCWVTILRASTILSSISRTRSHMRASSHSVNRTMIDPAQIRAAASPMPTARGRQSAGRRGSIPRNDRGRRPLVLREPSSTALKRTTHGRVFRCTRSCASDRSCSRVVEGRRDPHAGTSALVIRRGAQRPSRQRCETVRPETQTEPLGSGSRPPAGCFS